MDRPCGRCGYRPDLHSHHYRRVGRSAGRLADLRRAEHTHARIHRGEHRIQGGDRQCVHLPPAVHRIRAGTVHVLRLGREDLGHGIPEVIPGRRELRFAGHPRRTERRAHLVHGLRYHMVRQGCVRAAVPVPDPGFGRSTVGGGHRRDRAGGAVQGAAGVL